MAPPNQYKYTMVAGKAMDFAAMFNHAFSRGLQGPVEFKLDLTEPAGPSTGGGKQVIQHVRLVPVAGGAAIVIGQTNPVAMTAELRTLRHLAEIHAARFKGTPLPIDATAYAALDSQLSNFFAAQGMKVSHSDAAGPLSMPPPAPVAAAAGPGSMAWVWALVVLAIVGLTAAAVVLLRRGA